MFGIRGWISEIRKMAAAECWGALTGSGQTLFDNRKAGKSTPIIPTGLRSAGTSWCGFITSLLELSKTVENKGSSNNCLMKMWKRKPMSGAAETYPVSEEPKHKVYGAADSQDVIKRRIKIFWFDRNDGLGEFYD
jgi:hypothetical protein